MLSYKTNVKMTSDPKKEGIPAELQTQNRRPPTAEEKERIDAFMKKGAAPAVATNSRLPKGATPEIVAMFKKEEAAKKALADKKFKARMERANLRDHGTRWVPGAIWDTNRCRWINAEERREMEAKKNGEKTVADLTAEYNAVAAAKGMKTVKKFKDRATATMRLAAINGAVPAPEKVRENMVKEEKKSGTSGDEVINKFGFRKGSTRETLLKKLVASLGSMVTEKSLGEDLVATAKSGIEWKIDGCPGKDGKPTKAKLAFEIRSAKGEGGKSHGLFAK